MASIWKRPDSKYWIACFTAGDGRQLKRSTGVVAKAANAKKATGIADKYEEAARARRTVTQARRVLADLHKTLTGEALLATSVKDFFNGYIERKRPEVSHASLDYYKGHSKRFLEWLGDRAEKDIAEISKADIIAYRNVVAGRAGARTTNNTLKAVKTFFAAARKDGHLADDPAADVDIVRDRSESTRRPFTLAELRSILAVADDEWRSMILFGLYTGQRLADIAGLTWSNVDTVRGEVRLTTRKTGRKQVIPLAEPLKNHLAGLPANDDPKAALHPHAVAIMARNHGRSSPLSKAFAEILTAAGLRDDAAPEKGKPRSKHELSFHCLRHTATSLLKEAGIPASVVMSFIGHDSDTVSAGYTHTGKEALEKAAAALPSL